ncbi:hypothetical protein D9M68_973830 [compost metagenome]
MIGTPAAIAILNAPFLNGSSSPPRLRVPSGKTKIDVSWCLRVSVVVSIARLALRALSRSSSTLPASQ